MLTISEISKSFGDKQALSGVSFEVQPGEVVAVVGPSGCGKSTLLNIIAGLESPDHGLVAWEGLALTGIPPYRRGFGLMFQDFALFPHKNVYENVAFGLRMQSMPEEQIQHQVAQVLELVGLPGSGKRDVNTLSGGEQQRVALARALAPRPRLLMLDEPLGSLDRGLRERLVIELRDILHLSRQTAIYVTHDQEEAFSLADRLVIINAGMVEQIGAPEQVYRQPATAFVARFLGLNNLIPGKIILTGKDKLQVQTTIGQFDITTPGEFQPGGDVTVLFRPDMLQVGDSGSQRLEGILKETLFRGDSIRAWIEVQGTRLTVDLPSRNSLPNVGQAILLSFDTASAMQIFNK